MGGNTSGTCSSPKVLAILLQARRGCCARHARGVHGKILEFHATFVANLCHLLPLLTQLAGVAREEFGRKGAEHDYNFLQNLLDKSGICDKCNGSLFADATWKL